MTSSSRVLRILPVLLLLLAVLLQSPSGRNPGERNAGVPDAVVSETGRERPQDLTAPAFAPRIHRELHEARRFPRPERIDFRGRHGRFPQMPVALVERPHLGPLSRSAETLEVAEARADTTFPLRLIESGARSFGLPIGENDDEEVVVDTVLSRGGQTHTVLGSLENHPQSQVVLVFNGGAIAGSVVEFRSNTHLEFGSTGDGLVAIRLLDPTAFTATCGVSDTAADEDFHESVWNPAGPDADENGTGPATAAAQSGGPGTAATIIDSVIGYGRQAREADGGVDAIEARILAAVDRTNLAFANSGIEDLEVVLMGTIEDPDYEFPGRNDGGMGDGDELGDLRHPVDGSLDAISDFATELGADQTSLVVKEADGPAGIAYLQGSSLVMARTYMSSTSLVFPHELGHNIGCRHAWGDSGSDGATDITNYGWRFITPSFGERKTIMAYSSWSRVPNFSNPSVLFDGVPTGAPAGYDASDDPTADSKLVSGGYTGNHGAGYDGSHPSLGADNATYIRNNAVYLAGNLSRPTQLLRFELPGDEPLEHLFTVLPFRAESTGEEVTRTLVLRNTGGSTLEGITLGIEGGAGHFSAGSLSVSSLASGESAECTVTFTCPPDGGNDSVTLLATSTTGGVPTARIQLEGVYDPPLPRIQIEYPFGTPLTASAANLTMTADESGEVIDRVLTVRNAGELDLSGLSFAFDDNEAGVFSSTSPGSTTLAPGETTELTVSFTAGSPGLERATLRILSNDPATPEFRIELVGSLDGPIYAESLESGFGLWENTGDRDWTRRSGSTPTGLTGPSGAHDGTFYAFVEATASGSSVFRLEGTFDLTGYSDAEFRFRYHMYGSRIGTLQVDVWNGAWNNAVWSLSGKQQDDDDSPWGLATVDLGDYLGSQPLRIRFHATTQGLSSGDMAIDAFELSADPLTWNLSYSAGTGGSLSGTTEQSVADGGTGSEVGAHADTGYRFVRWSDGSTDNPRTDASVGSDLEVAAVFHPEVISSYADWVLVAGPPADADGPGDRELAGGPGNLLRYAFDLDASGNPAGGQIVSSSVDATETDRLTITFLRRRNATDLIYRVQFSPSPDEAEEWTTVTDERSVTQIDDSWERVTVEDTVTTDSADRRFARVAVEIIDN